MVEDVHCKNKKWAPKHRRCP